MKARVLFAHNHYRSSLPSGEAQVLEAERELLDRNGHEVRVFYRHSDLLLEQGLYGNIKGALSTPWNPFAAKAIDQEVKGFLPDVVHVHNTFPLISPSIFHMVGKRAARVLTLHNYRLFCPAAIPMRAGEFCTDCMDSQNVWPSLVHGCYRNSRIATAPLALSVALHRNLGTWKKQVDAFIVLTEFQRDLMVKAGLSRELVHVKPNFFSGAPRVVPWGKRKPHVVFVGRLSAEKGGATLLRAWFEWGESAPELRIIGEGEERERLEELADTRPRLPIRFLGKLSRDETLGEIAESSLLILPSLITETFGMAVLEAFACGTPVAASDIKVLSSIVTPGENGLLFSPGKPKSILQVVKKAWNETGTLKELAAGASRTFEEKYTGKANYGALMDIYSKALHVKNVRSA